MHGLVLFGNGGGLFRGLKPNLNLQSDSFVQKHFHNLRKYLSILLSILRPKIAPNAVMTPPKRRILLFVFTV